MAQPDEESMTDSNSLRGIHRGKSLFCYDAKSDSAEWRINI
jgi:hypothetical protein